jgi:hypothetical protein
VTGCTPGVHHAPAEGADGAQTPEAGRPATPGCGAQDPTRCRRRREAAAATRPARSGPEPCRRAPPVRPRPAPGPAGRRASRAASPRWEPGRRRAPAAAPVARLRPRATPAHPTTARGAESAGGPVPSGRGRAPERPEVSAAPRRRWAAPDRGHPAAGRCQRGATPARVGASRPRGPPSGPRVLPGWPPVSAAPAHGLWAVASRPCGGRLSTTVCGRPRPDLAGPHGTPVPGPAWPFPPARRAGQPSTPPRQRFSRGSGWINMPERVVQRCRATKWWGRLRATKTLLR